jgi:Peptidase inhibitor family I36
MNVIQRVVAVLAGALLAIAVAGAVPMPAQAKGLTWDDQTGIIIQAWSCNTGNVCFYTGPDGTGSRCMWSVADSDWATGTDVCSWALTTNVKSIWNRGTSSSYTGVAYYKQTGYTDRVGCTRQGASGNLAGTYKVRSHRWISGSCG